MLFDLNNRVKFFTVAEIAIALIRHTAGVATRIKRTVAPTEFMVVWPYITINIVVSDRFLNQKSNLTGKKKKQDVEIKINEDHAVG